MARAAAGWADSRAPSRLMNLAPIDARRLPERLRTAPRRASNRRESRAPTGRSLKRIARGCGQVRSHPNVLQKPVGGDLDQGSRLRAPPVTLFPSLAGRLLIFGLFAGGRFFPVPAVLLAIQSTSIRLRGSTLSHEDCLRPTGRAQRSQTWSRVWGRVR